MKTLLFGQNTEPIAALCGEHAFFELVNEDPELVIAYGGDGTLLQAEHAYPGVPKFLLGNSAHANKAHRRSNDEVLAQVAREAYVVSEYSKLQATYGGTTLTALNDIVVHNADPRHALRYTVMIDEMQYAGEIIGDGIVVATPQFGATGYYRSITDSTFEVGIGLAFNNSHEQRDHVVLHEDRTITLTITRGPALCYADNQELFLTVEKGESVTIKKAPSVARIVRANK